MIAKLMEFEERHVASMSADSDSVAALPNMQISHKNLDGSFAGDCASALISRQ